jgi:hypothetical protein
MNEIVQLKIVLDGSNPPIWRQVLVSNHITFFELHHIIQIAMGWQNYHAFQFRCMEQEIGDTKNDFYDEEDSPLLEVRETKLNQFELQPELVIDYIYDFGDGWEHTLVVEALLPRNPKSSYPTCIAGEMRCPLEDSGGLYGYYETLDIFANPKHPEYEDVVEWIGNKRFDPKKFDPKKVNKELKQLAMYIRSWDMWR